MATPYGNISGRRRHFFFTITAVAILVSQFSTHVWSGEKKNSPRIENLQAVLYSGYLVLIGYVYDDDNDPAGWVVRIEGDVEGSATVDSTGRFLFTSPYFGDYGEGSVSTRDPQGHETTSSFEFYD